MALRPFAFSFVRSPRFPTAFFYGFVLLLRVYNIILTGRLRRVLSVSVSSPSRSRSNTYDAARERTDNNRTSWHYFLFRYRDTLDEVHNSRPFREYVYGLPHRNDNYRGSQSIVDYNYYYN